MIKTYYKFKLDKEEILSDEQTAYEGEDERCFTCIIWIYEDTIWDVNLDITSVKNQLGVLIPRWYVYIDSNWKETKKNLVWFLIEGLFTENLRSHYYDSFTFKK
jgi:hypothetical protein